MQALSSWHDTSSATSGSESSSSENYPNYISDYSRNELHEVFNSDDSLQEDNSAYRLGGYYPVRPGDIYNSRYRVEDILGYGAFGTVWRCCDEKYKRFVATKISKSALIYTNAARNERELIDLAHSIDESDERRRRLVRVLDAFRIRGPNGEHECIVFNEHGDNLYEVHRRNKSLSLDYIRIVLRQTFEGLAYLHDICHIVHTDLKPENILIKTNATTMQLTGEARKADLVISAKRSPLISLLSRRRTRNNKAKKAKNGAPTPPGISVQIADFGNAHVIHKPFIAKIQTRQYRAIEVLVGAAYTKSVDIWSMGCIAFEIIASELVSDEQGKKRHSDNFLFCPHADERSSADVDHIGQIVDLLGPLPPTLIREGKLWTALCAQKGAEKYMLMRRKTKSIVDELKYSGKEKEMQARAIGDFLLPMLTLKPDERATAAECLAHPWLSSSA